MTVGLWQRLDQTARHLMPFAVTTLAMLLGMVPMQIPYYAVVTPPLVLVSIFYWAIHRPDLLRPSVVFLLGVLQDLLSGAPLGISPLVYIIAYWLLIAQRRFFLGGGFLALWWGFAIVAMVAALVQWLAYSVILVSLVDFAPAGFQALLAIAVFPLPAWACMRLHRAFLN